MKKKHSQIRPFIMDTFTHRLNAFLIYTVRSLLAENSLYLNPTSTVIIIYSATSTSFNMIELAVPANVHVRPYLTLQPLDVNSISSVKPKTRTMTTRTLETKTSFVFGAFNRTLGGQLAAKGDFNGDDQEKGKSKKRVFFLDVNPLCYEGSTPSLRSFGRWMSLFFDQVSRSDPVIAVLDGERGNEHRRQLLPSYKAQRRKSVGQLTTSRRFSKDHVGRSCDSRQLVIDVLQKCNVPVVKINGHEADDVVATLVEQVLQRGYCAVIASPDKDFKQLISEDVQLVMPLNDLERWSFYTIKHYIAQYNCDPHSDLSLRCIMGDEVDGVPGIQHVVPGFGRKTALKLLKKHGSLENLLNAAAVRTVGREYAQEALTKYADYLRRNYEVLALRRDINIHLEEEWLIERDTGNDSIILSNLFTSLEAKQNHAQQTRSHFSNG